MSGQPYKNAMDIAKFRKEYLSTLALQAGINEKNFQANQIYTRTGAPSQPTDTRTTTEKLADLYRLRIEIRSRLGEIMSGDDAQKVVEGLDDNEARFLAQQLDTIVADIKPKYKLGIPAEAFNTYLNRYMTKFQATSGVDTGTIEQVIAMLPTPEQLRALRTEVSGVQGLAPTAERDLNRNLQTLTELVEALPNILAEINRTQNAITRDELIETLSGAVDELPTFRQIETLLRNFSLAREKRDAMMMDEILRQLRNIIVSGEDIPERIKALGERLGEEPVPTEAYIPQIATAEMPSLSTQDITDDKGITYEYITPENLTGLPNNSTKFQSKSGYVSVLNAMQNKLQVPASERLDIPSKTRMGSLPSTSIIEIFTREDDKIRRLFSKVKPPEKMGGTGFSTGLNPNKKIIRGRGVSYPKIDYNAGIQREPDYVPFGRYIINRKKLADGIFMVKRVGGQFISDMKTRRISPNLTTIFRKVAGGNIPSFGDLEKLDDEEREYLRFVSRKSSLSSKLEVPSPKKDPEEALINQFEIMRGQLIAGNDSKELMKKFKKVLVDMLDKDLIPKGQAKDILVELAKREY